MQRLLIIAFTCLIGSSSFSQNVLLSEDFENSTLPSGWSQYTLSNDGGWLNGNNELIKYEYINRYKNISPCLLLHFNTDPKVRPIRKHRFLEYEKVFEKL